MGVSFKGVPCTLPFALGQSIPHLGLPLQQAPIVIAKRSTLFLLFCIEAISSSSRAMSWLLLTVTF